MYIKKGYRARTTTESFKKQMYEAWGDEYEVLGEFTKSANKILVKHSICGREWSVVATAIKNKRISCPTCSREKAAKAAIKESGDRFKDRVANKTNGEYMVISEYLGENSPITIKHLLCSNEYNTQPRFFTRGNRCPHCNPAKRVPEALAIERLRNKCGNKFSIVKYSNAISTKSTVKNNICNHEFDVKVSTLLANPNYKCPICRKEKSKSSKVALIQKDIENKNLNWNITWNNNDSYSVSSIVCKKCGTQAKNKIIKTTTMLKCCTCNPISKKYILTTPDAILDFFKNNYNGEYIPNVTANTLSSKPIEFIHSVCRKTFTKQPSAVMTTLKNGKIACPYCNPNKKDVFISKEARQKQINELYGKNEYIITDNYKNTDDPFTLRHKCGYEFTTIGKYLWGKKHGKGYFCEKCWPEYSKNTYPQKVVPYSPKEVVQKYLDNLFGKGEWEILEDYKTMKKPILFKHKCGGQYKVAPRTIFKKTADSYCAVCHSKFSSIGENRVQRYLSNNNIHFAQQYIFKDCLSQTLHHLYFDFVILDDNDNPIAAIEFDGQQHFEACDFFGGNTTFLKQKQNDDIKNKYCKEKDIPLLRIKYSQMDEIESLLENFI